MPSIKQLNVKLTLLTQGFENALNKAKWKLRRSSREFSRVGMELSAAITLPLVGVGVQAIRSAGELEALKLSLQATMQGAGRSIEDVRNELTELRIAAQAPGLDFEQAIKASVRLQNVEMSAEAARKTIIELANAIALSGGTAQDLDGVTIQFAQMIAKGKVMSQDLRIIQERIPVITKLMKEAFGTSSAENLQKMGVTGRQFVDEITRRMANLERVSSGLKNTIVNFFVNIKIAAAEFGMAIDEALDVRGNLDRFSGWISGLVERFKNLDKGTQALIVKTGLYAAALGPALKLLGSLTGVASLLFANLKSVVSVLKGVAAGAIKASRAIAAMSVAMRATVFLGAAAAIAGVVAVVSKLNEKLVDTQKITDEATAGIRQMQAAFNEEIRIATDANTTQEEREKIIRAINDRYGSYLKNLISEKASIDEIKKAQAEANKVFEKKILLTGFQAIAEEISRRIAEVQVQAVKLQKQLDEALTPPSTGVEKVLNAIKDSFWSNSRAVISLNNKIQNNEALQRRLQAELDNTREAAKKAGLELSELFGGVASGGTDTELNNNLNPFGTLNTDEVKSKVDDISEILNKLNSEFASIDTQSVIFGDAFDKNAEKINALKNAIISLIEEGLRPGDAELDNLIKRYKGLSGEIEKLPTALEPLEERIPDITEKFRANAEAMSEAIAGSGTVIGDMLLHASNAVQDMARSGEVSFKKFASAALRAAADVLRAQIIEGVAYVMKDALKKFGVAGIAIAGVAGAAAGALFSTVINGLTAPKFAKGAIVRQPTLAMFGEYPGASSNPEFALRQDQLQAVISSAIAQHGGARNSHITGEVRWSGRDMIIALREAERKFGRGV